MKHKIILRMLLCAGLLFTFCGQLAAQPISLDSCFALAQKNNAEIRTSQLEVKRAQAVKRQVFTKYFPQMKLMGMGYVAAKPMISFGLEDIQSNDIRELLTAIYDIFSQETDINDHLELMKNGMSGSVVAVQPVFAGGRIVNGNKLASLGEEAAELQAEIKMRDVLENIESSYYLVVGLKEKEATMAAALTLIDSLDKVVASALANGLVTRADALQIELKRNEITSMHQKLTSGTRLARRLLCTQIGIEYTDDIEFGEENGWGESGEQIMMESRNGVQERPENRLLEINVESQKLFKKMTLGETLPQLALFGIGYYGNPVRNYATGNALAGVSLTIPLTDWWETSHKLQEHNVKIEQARLMQENYSQLMSLEEEKAYSDMMDALLLIRSDSLALDIARENYRLANLNYAAGNITLSEVLQAHTLLLQAENAVTDRRISYLVARRRLQDLTSPSSNRRSR